MVTILKDRCKGCGLCIMACPQKLLKLSSEYNIHGVNPIMLIDSEKCVRCGLCCILCPDMALEI